MSLSLFSDLALARRLEAAEGYACAQFALARRRLFPESGSEAVRIAGADVVYDGPASPTTQTFGLGMFADPDDAALQQMENFFTSRGAPVQHEVCPFAGAATLQLLCARGYHPIEISNVLYRATLEEGAPGPSHLGTGDGTSQAADPAGSPQSGAPCLASETRDGASQAADLRGSAESLRVRLIGSAESALWTHISTRGWTHEHPEFEDFMRQAGALLTAREGSACFLAEIDAQPGAAGALSIHDGVALFAGASTVPELRRRGLQSALLEARMRYAREQGCDVAMMVAEPGSNSQRNAERQGFRIAYTRIKWQKSSF